MLQNMSTCPSFYVNNFVLFPSNLPSNKTMMVSDEFVFSFLTFRVNYNLQKPEDTDKILNCCFSYQVCSKVKSNILSMTALQRPHCFLCRWGESCNCLRQSNFPWGVQHNQKEQLKKCAHASLVKWFRLCRNDQASIVSKLWRAFFNVNPKGINSHE